VSVQTEILGGRLPLLDSQALSAPQKKTYDRLNTTGMRGIGAQFVGHQQRDREFADSPLEQSGFELPVPRAVEAALSGDGAMVGVGRPSVSAPFTVGPEFESPLLQRRVTSELYIR
jgi:hypothetical protein